MSDNKFKVGQVYKNTASEEVHITEQVGEILLGTNLSTKVRVAYSTQGTALKSAYTYYNLVAPRKSVEYKCVRHDGTASDWVKYTGNYLNFVSTIAGFVRLDGGTPEFYATADLLKNALYKYYGKVNF
jgi:hypothetical protein